MNPDRLERKPQDLAVRLRSAAVNLPTVGKAARRTLARPSVSKMVEGRRFLLAVARQCSRCVVRSRASRRAPRGRAAGGGSTPCTPSRSGRWQATLAPPRATPPPQSLHTHAGAPGQPVERRRGGASGQPQRAAETKAVAAEPELGSRPPNPKAAPGGLQTPDQLDQCAPPPRPTPQLPPAEPQPSFWNPV